MEYYLVQMYQVCRTVGSIDATKVQRCGSVSDDASEQVMHNERINVCLLPAYICCWNSEEKMSEKWTKS